jgi:large subunit ribosomal protein L23
MTVILRPLVSEKSMGLTKTGFYTFEVARAATKEQIAAVVAEKFKVKVVSVNTINIIGKTKTQRTRKGYFVQPHLKKAIVRVGKGDKIALFEQVTADPHAGHNHANDDVEVRTAEGEVVSVKEKKSLLRGTKVKIEKQAESVENDQRKLARSEEHRSATKTSSTPERKPKS